MKASVLADDLRHERKIRYRYNSSGRWYRGSLHVHTERSDGHLSLDKVAHNYADEQFDFISITDHWRLPDLNPDHKTLPLLVIPGIELDGCDSGGVRNV